MMRRLLLILTFVSVFPIPEAARAKISNKPMLKEEDILGVDATLTSSGDNSLKASGTSR